MPFQNRQLRIYSAPVLAQVTQMRHLLEMRGIECRIQGEHRAGLGAQIGPAEAWPELWVIDPAHVEEARRVVDETLQPSASAEPDWTCPRCSEVNEGQFGACWNCGTGVPTDSNA